MQEKDERVYAKTNWKVEQLSVKYERKKFYQEVNNKENFATKTSCI